jgi:hypothetical protein
MELLRSFYYDKLPMAEVADNIWLFGRTIGNRAKV